MCCASYILQLYWRISNASEERDEKSEELDDVMRRGKRSQHHHVLIYINIYDLLFSSPPNPVIRLRRAAGDGHALQRQIGVVLAACPSRLNDLTGEIEASVCTLEVCCCCCCWFDVFVVVWSRR